MPNYEMQVCMWCQVIDGNRISFLLINQQHYDQSRIYLLVNLGSAPTIAANGHIAASYSSNFLFATAVCHEVAVATPSQLDSRSLGANIDGFRGGQVKSTPQSQPTSEEDAHLSVRGFPKTRERAGKEAADEMCAAYLLYESYPRRTDLVQTSEDLTSMFYTARGCTCHATQLTSNLSG